MYARAWYFMLVLTDLTAVFGLVIIQYSSSRRLPSRLFSSTRRLFGAGYTSTAPTHASNSSISSTSSRTTHGQTSSVSSLASVSSLHTLAGNNPTTPTASSPTYAPTQVTQQRRLAEFATVLGDYKLATTVWEALRKDGRGGSDVLPLLVAPSPSLALHAAHALSMLFQGVRGGSGGEAPAHVQYRALVYAVRWEAGMDRREFLGNVLEGERWLVGAAGSVRFASLARGVLG